MKNLILNQFQRLLFIFLLGIGFLIGGTQQLYATHAAGSDIKYRCLGGLQYEVEVTFYRDCGGVAEPSNVTLNYKSTSAGVNSNATANKIASTGQEITVPCTSSASTCGGGTTTGIRKFVYSATITLPSARADWVFSYSVCCRNCAITTITNPCGSNSTLYVEATLNNLLAPCNSSPTFSNIPIAFVCLGQSFNYNHGVIDPDGDSLAYQLITPKTTSTTNVTFIAPATVSSPVASSTPFFMNAITGDLNFTPSAVQISIMAILVKEYRNGQLIGTVIRDMQIYTTSCNNNLPTATGINGTNNFNVTVCPNQQLCFTINTADLDASQIVSMTTNNGITNATYTISSGNRPTLTFCWTPTVNDIDLITKTFTVTVRDNACPSNGVQTYSYNILVPSPYYNVTSTNINCNGSTTGSASASPIYSGNYTYNWNTTPATLASTISNVGAGSYTVTVTDISGCSAQQTVNITQPSGITLSGSTTNPSCVGRCNGNIDLTVIGGTAPYTYAWNNSSTTQDLTNLCSGSYSVNVTDANNCTKTISFTLANSYTLNATSNATSVSCYAGNSGGITTSILGGTTPFTYSWNNGATSQNLSNALSGTYTVTITDANSCTTTTSSQITQPSAALNVTTTKTDVKCFGTSTGSITTTVTGGTSPYFYLWNNGATSSGLNNISSGTYTVTITDNKGCTSNKSISVSQPLLALSVTTNKTDVLCFSNSTGAISTTVSGGTSPYTYIWNTGSTATSLNNLGAGTYSVTITDANSCTAFASVNINQPLASLNALSNSSNVNCFGGLTGSISIILIGGTSPYNYNWNNGITSQNLSNVGAGTYSVTITDANNCTITKQSTITQPSSALTATNTKTNVLCFGNNTGAINITTTGGTSPYSYNWNTSSTTQNLNSLNAGTYNVTITDSKGCTTSSSAIIIQPSSALNISTTKIDIRCFGDLTGIASVFANGGTSPYVYVWSNGSTTPTINNLTAVIYTITVNDANNCSSSEIVTLSQPSAALSATTSSTNVKCKDENSGSANINVSNGTAPYTYLWSNGNGTATSSNLLAGIYTVTITDNAGCSIQKNYTINEPSAILQTSITGTNVKCYGQSTGAANLLVNGGTAPYTYLWNNGSTTQDLNNIAIGNYTVTVTDANNCTSTTDIIISQPLAAINLVASGTDINCKNGLDGTITTTANGGTAPYTYSWSNSATTANINSLSAGSYTVTLTDNNGCTATQSTSLTQPNAQIVLSTTHTNVTCNGLPAGSIDLTVAGGTFPYTYLWNIGSSNQDVTNLTAGTYHVTVTDNNGCTETISETISQPVGALNASSLLTNALCYGDNNGSINITATAGTPPYSYNWSNGANTEDLNNLTAGTYTVTISDNNACAIVYTLFITQPSAILSTSFVGTNLTCYENNTGAIDLTIAGGNEPYTISWSNGANSEDLTGISAGNYIVSITDVNGCTTSSNTSISQPSGALTISSNIKNLNCHDVDDGSIDLTISGGTSPYTFIWDDGTTTEDLSNLVQGIYSVTVTDANGCSTSQSFTITYNALTLTASGTITSVACHNENTGSIDLDIQGGIAPYTYSWSNNTTSQDLLNVNAGSYTVSIIDNNGCATIYSGFVNQPAAGILLTQSVNSVLCYGNETGSIDINASGGTFPYSFNWSNGSTQEDIQGLIAGLYTITITDANNCILSAAITVDQPSDSLNVGFSTTNPLCYGENTGSILTSITGGTAAYTVLWNNQPIGPDLINFSAGSYTIEITDANFCILSKTLILDQPLASLTTTAQITNIDCNGNSTGNATLQTSGGSLPYTYQWSNGNVTETATGLIAGNYQYTITDSHLCSITGSISIMQPSNAINLSYTNTNVNCFGLSIATIDLTVSGGTTPYTYLWSNADISEDLNSLMAGDYTVTVTDANGCSSNKTINISQPLATLSVAGTLTNLTCHLNNTGSINLITSGGTAPYNYSWTNGDSTSSINSLGAGNYDVLVTDANGCSNSSTFNLTQPTASLSASSTTTNVSCNGNNNGGISIITNGGTMPYTYSWNNGETTSTITNLVYGNYTVTITDSNNCTYIYSTLVQQPTATLDVTYLVTDVMCYGNQTGSIASVVTGGTSPYTYSWSNGITTSSIQNLIAGTYTLTVTDSNNCTKTLPVSVSQPFAPVNAILTAYNINCNSALTGKIDLVVSGGMGNYTYQWNTGDTIQNLINLPSGNYSVIVTDQNGCTTNTSGKIDQPTSSLTITASVYNVSCKGTANGRIELNVSGGTPSYTYLWNNGSSSSQLPGITPGTYTATVTDANGCTSLYTTGIQEPVDQLNVTTQVNNASCLVNKLGNIFIQVSGGTAPYSFMWNDGQTAQNRINEIVGSYTVTTTDANGCNESRNALIADTSVLNITSLGDVNICMGDKVVLLADSFPGSILQWNYNGTPLNGATSNSFVTPVAGNYSLTVNTTCGIYTSNSIDVIVRTMNSVSISNNVIICKGEKFQLIASGGTDYQWSPTDGLNFSNVANPTASPTKTTDYTVTIKDQYGCKATASVTVTLGCDTLDIPNGFSPNDDGTNDYFTIDGINNYPGNSIFIYNRWGNLIFKERDYNNKWNGSSNVGGVMFGEKLPNGTYYFILDLNNEQKPINGFVVIRR